MISKNGLKREHGFALSKAWVSGWLPKLIVDTFNTFDEDIKDIP